MRKKTGLISIILAAVVIFGSMTGCGARGRLIELMSEFEYGCNTMDVKAVLKTIDPRVADKFRFGVSLIELFSGKSSDEIIGSIFKNLPDEFSDNGEEIFTTVSFEAEAIDIGDDSAELTAVMEYEILGESYKREVVFRFVYYIDDWYISSIELE